MQVWQKFTLPEYVDAHGRSAISICIDCPHNQRGTAVMDVLSRFDPPAGASMASEALKKVAAKCFPGSHCHRQAHMHQFKVQMPDPALYHELYYKLG